MTLSTFSNYKLFALISLLISLVFPYAAQRPNQSVPMGPSSITSEPLVFTAAVTASNGTFVIGLEKDNFEVLIDKVPARILYARTEDVPLSVGLIFDSSASVGDPGSKKATRTMMNDLQRALKGFIERSNPASEYFLLAFNDKPQLLLDWTSDSRAIVDTLGAVQPKGVTAFYDACYLAVDKVQHGRYPKRVLIVISDGMDTNSHYFFKHVREALKESNVLLYSLNVSSPPDAGSNMPLEGERVLNELSELTGGMSYRQAAGKRLQSRDAESVLQIIAIELQNQYSIAIVPAVLKANDSQWHKLKVKVTPPGNAAEMKLSARTRQGFYLKR
jgi:Ca-activated chloride channel family protein